MPRHIEIVMSADQMRILKEAWKSGFSSYVAAGLASTTPWVARREYDGFVETMGPQQKKVRKRHAQVSHITPEQRMVIKKGFDSDWTLGRTVTESGYYYNGVKEMWKSWGYVGPMDSRRYGRERLRKAIKAHRLGKSIAEAASYAGLTSNQVMRIWHTRDLAAHGTAPSPLHLWEIEWVLQELREGKLSNRVAFDFELEFLRPISESAVRKIGYRYGVISDKYRETLQEKALRNQEYEALRKAVRDRYLNDEMPEDIARSLSIKPRHAYRWLSADALRGYRVDLPYSAIKSIRHAFFKIDSDARSVAEENHATLPQVRGIWGRMWAAGYRRPPINKPHEELREAVRRGRKPQYIETVPRAMPQAASAQLDLGSLARPARAPRKVGI